MKTETPSIEEIAHYVDMAIRKRVWQLCRHGHDVYGFFYVGLDNNYVDVVILRGVR